MKKLLAILCLWLLAAGAAWAEGRPRASRSGGEAIECANLIYAGTKSSVCFSDRFLSSLAADTTIGTSRKFRPVKLAGVELFGYPFAIMTGEGSFSLTLAERANLRRYLERGGFRWNLGLNGYLNHDAAAEFRGAGVDLALKFSGLSFYAEAVWAKGIPNPASEDVFTLQDETERWGMYAQTGYMLPFDFMDLEIAARFAMMDNQVYMDDGGDLWELTAGINAYFLEDIVKLMINYVKREEQHGKSLDNDMAAAMLQLKF